MPATRSNADFNHVTEWTDSILEVPNQSSFIKSKGLFQENFTNQEAILFDRIESEVTLLPDSNRRGGPASYGKDDDVTTFSLRLAYFHHMDSITKQDYMSKRRAGTSDEQDTKAAVVAGKLAKGRRAVDQTHEYMMLQAIKGVCKTPQGTTLADMFSEFNITQTEVDFDLGTAATDVDAKIAEVKDTVAKNLKTGGMIAGPLEIIVDRSFFNKLKAHPNVAQAYLNSTSNIRYQQDLSDYMTWGISDVFEYQGVRFMVYSHTFTLPNGNTENAVEANTGHVIPNVVGDSIFRAYYGPSQRMDVDGGSEMFAFQFEDPKGRYSELDFETAPLMVATKPAALVKVKTTT